MDDELRKAAQVALAAMEKEWDTKLSKGNAYSFMKAARALRAAIAKNANAAPQDQAKDAARWRFLTQQMDESEVDYLFCFDASDWAGRVDAAMQQEQKP